MPSFSQSLSSAPFDFFGAYQAAKAAKEAKEQENQRYSDKMNQQDWDRQMQVAELNMKRQALNQRPGASGTPKEKMLGAPAISNLSEGRFIPSLLDDVEQTVKTKGNLFGPVSGRLGQLNPYNKEAQVVESKMATAAQIIGKYMEGGVLRAEDIPKYRAMLPQLRDTKEVADQKLKQVREILSRKYNTDIESFGASGYDASAFPPMQVTPAQEEAPVQNQTLAARLASIRARKK